MFAKRASGRRRPAINVGWGYSVVERKLIGAKSDKVNSRVKLKNNMCSRIRSLLASATQINRGLIRWSKGSNQMNDFLVRLCEDGCQLVSNESR